MAERNAPILRAAQAAVDAYKAAQDAVKKAAEDAKRPPEPLAP